MNKKTLVALCMSLGALAAGCIDGRQINSASRDAMEVCMRYDEADDTVVHACVHGVNMGVYGANGYRSYGEHDVPAIMAHARSQCTSLYGSDNPSGDACQAGLNAFASSLERQLNSAYTGGSHMPSVEDSRSHGREMRM